MVTIAASGSISGSLRVEAVVRVDEMLPVVCFRAGGFAGYAT
jgi:hypothetical protein